MFNSFEPNRKNWDLVDRDCLCLSPESADPGTSFREGFPFTSENDEVLPTFVPQDLFLWFSYFVPVPKRVILVPTKTLIVFAPPEMAS